MINLKKIFIVIISILCSVNIAFGMPIYKSSNTHINTNVTIGQYQRIHYTATFNKFYSQNYHNLLNCSLFGSKRYNYGCIGYFTMGYNFDKLNPFLTYQKKKISYIHPIVLGIYSDKIGIIEYGQEHNLIHDLNLFTKILFYNNNGIQAYSQELYPLNTSITYKNCNGFGLIDHLTISSQYQDPEPHPFHTFQKNLLNNMIQYDFNRIKLSIAAAYSANIQHYMHLNKYNILQDQRETYACAAKLGLNKLYCAIFFRENHNIDTNDRFKSINFHKTRDIEFFSGYKITKKIFATIGYTHNSSWEDNKTNNNTILDSINLLKYSKLVKVLDQFNLSMRYSVSKNVFLYVNDEVSIPDIKKIDFSILKRITNILEGGIVYSF